MNHLKLYEEFHSQQDYITVVNQLINNESAMKWINKTLNSLPERFRKKLINFVNKPTIDITQLEKVEKRYNILQKVKYLYDKGVKNFKDIIDKIIPKNEATMFVEVITVLGLIAFFITGIATFIAYGDRLDDFKAWIRIPILALWMVISIGTAIFGIPAAVVNFSDQREKEIYRKEMADKYDKEALLKKTSEELNQVIVQNGIAADTVMLVRDAFGNYKIEIKGMDETLW
jgi:hypothetical protein